MHKIKTGPTVSLGIPKTATATRFLLLGSGEPGKEIAIEVQRLGVEVIAVDRYANAPAMQVAPFFVNPLVMCR